MPTRAISKFSAVKTSFRSGSLPLHQAKSLHNSATSSCDKVARKKTTPLAPNIRTPNLEKPIIKRNVEKKRPADNCCHRVFTARATGLGPATTGSTVRYSNQLSYAPKSLRIVATLFGIAGLSRSIAGDREPWFRSATEMCQQRLICLGGQARIRIPFVRRMEWHNE